MIKQLRTTIITLLFIISSLSCYADDYDKAFLLVEEGEIFPLEDLVANMRKTHDARILEIELEKKHGRLIYEIEAIRKDGVVIEIYYDAHSGKQLSVR